MSKPKFTPGPWGWCMPDEVFPAVFCNENGNIIADLYDAKNNQRQMVANAALIAAAPEMYEFIEWLRSVEGQCAILKAKRYLPQILDKVDEILKKARGEG